MHWLFASGNQSTGASTSTSGYWEGKGPRGSGSGPSRDLQSNKWSRLAHRTEKRVCVSKSQGPQPWPAVHPTPWMAHHSEAHIILWDSHSYSPHWLLGNWDSETGHNCVHSYPAKNRGAGKWSPNWQIPSVGLSQLPHMITTADLSKCSQLGLEWTWRLL